MSINGSINSINISAARLINRICQPLSNISLCRYWIGIYNDGSEWYHNYFANMGNEQQKQQKMAEYQRQQQMMAQQQAAANKKQQEQEKAGQMQIKS